ncbi:membrane protein insertase YidC [soil metagenome]
MEKRILMAVLLMTVVILVTNWLFPPPPAPEMVETDPAAVTAPGAPAAPAFRAPVTPLPAAGVPADTIVISSPLYRYAVSTRGAALVRAEMLDYPSYTHPNQQVQLVPDGAETVLATRIVVGGDTLDLRSAPFRAEGGSTTLQPGDAPYELRLSYGEPGQLGTEVVYTFHPDRYLVEVRGRVLGLNGAPATLLTHLGPGLAPHEDPAHRSEQQLAVVGRSSDGVENLRMEKARGEQAMEGPLLWAGVKDKYFLSALLVPEGSAGFSGVLTRKLPNDSLALERGGRIEILSIPRVDATTVLAIGPDGTFAYNVYLGPQDYDRLVAAGQRLQDVNPFGYRFLRPVVRPIAAGILWVLNVLHNTLGIGYGWVLILFGVLMRIVLWPLNAKAMRSQMKNMAVQPMLQARMKEVREKYKDDPKQQQQAMMGVYQELGVNPFSMLSGCLPLLIPMPVLITLFFVFQDSILFRGVSFLWLPDLSLRDPLYLLPVFLVVSMFGLQWISAKVSGMEQNPQMKMMMYIMPLFMGVIFFALPAGLNLYYATTNVATIPQQVLIGRERKKATEELNRKNGPPRPGSPAPKGGSRAPRAKRRVKRKS